MHLAKKVILFRSTSRRGIMLTTHQLPTSTFETSDWAKSVLNDARRIDHQKKVAEQNRYTVTTNHAIIFELGGQIILYAICPSFYAIICHSFLGIPKGNL